MSNRGKRRPSTSKSTEKKNDLEPGFAAVSVGIIEALEQAKFREFNTTVPRSLLSTDPPGQIHFPADPFTESKFDLIFSVGLKERLKPPADPWVLKPVKIFAIFDTYEQSQAYIRALAASNVIQETRFQGRSVSTLLSSVPDLNATYEDIPVISIPESNFEQLPNQHGVSQVAQFYETFALDEGERMDQESLDVSNCPSQSDGIDTASVSNGPISHVLNAEAHSAATPSQESIGSRGIGSTPRLNAASFITTPNSPLLPLTENPADMFAKVTEHLVGMENRLTCAVVKVQNSCDSLNAKVVVLERSFDELRTLTVSKKKADGDDVFGYTEMLAKYQFSLPFTGFDTFLKFDQATIQEQYEDLKNCLFTTTPSEATVKSNVYRIFHAFFTPDVLNHYVPKQASGIKIAFKNSQFYKCLFDALLRVYQGSQKEFNDTILMKFVTNMISNKGDWNGGRGRRSNPKQTDQSCSTPARRVSSNQENDEILSSSLLEVFQSPAKRARTQVDLDLSGTDNQVLQTIDQNAGNTSQ